MREDFKISLKVSWQEYGNVIYIINEESKSMYYLQDEVARLCWRTLAYCENQEKVFTDYFGRMEFQSEERKQVKKDILNFYNCMNKNGLIEVRK